MQHRLEASYEGEASSVPAARHAVERALTAWGLDDLGWTAALLVSELAANVTLHAGTGFTVVLEGLPDGGVRLAVSDGSTRVPRQRRFGDEATTGRGLHLVEDLSAAWGVEPTPGGKTVWAEIRSAGDAGGSRDEDGAEVDLDALLLSFPDAGEPGPTARTA